MNSPTPSEPKTTEFPMFQHFDHLYLERCELEARRLRAQAFAKGMRMLARFIGKTVQKLVQSVQSGFSTQPKNGLNTGIDGKPGRFA